MIDVSVLMVLSTTFTVIGGFFNLLALGLERKSGGTWTVLLLGYFGIANGLLGLTFLFSALVVLLEKNYAC